MFQFFSFVFKFVCASIIVGAGLSALDMNAEDLLARAGLTPETISTAAEQALQWAIPNMTLGALVVVPLWFVLFMMRPPRDR